MYNNSNFEFRPELQVMVEQSMAADTKFIGDLVFPVYPVQTSTGKYKRLNRGKAQLLTDLGGAGGTDPLRRAPGTAYREITRGSEDATYTTVDRGLTEVIDHKLKQEEERFFDVMSATSKLLMRNIRTEREIRIAAKVFNESIWGTAQNAAVSYLDANLATIDFAKDVISAKQTVDKRQEDANTMVISRPIWDLALRTEKLRTYFFGTSGGNANIDSSMIMEKFGISNILIGSSSYDSTKLNKNSSDSTLNWVWSSNYIWIGNVTGGAPEAGGAGRTFALDQTTDGQTFVTESREDFDRRSTLLRIRTDDEQNTVNEAAGILVKINA